MATIGRLAAEGQGGAGSFREASSGTRARDIRPRRARLVFPMAAALLIVWLPAARATFPGDNGLIAFASGEGGDTEIYTINPDGTGKIQLTFDTTEDRLPAWSPDGTRIAWQSYADGDAEIWVMNADGTGKTQLTSNSLEDSGAQWSPDGAKLVFARDLDGGTFDAASEIFVMNADGTGVVQLTSNSHFDCCPAFSPDGSTIAFQPVSGSGSYDIWKMNVDGTGQTPVASSGFYEVEANWAPDGSKIFFAKDFGFGSGWGEIMTVNPDGTGLTNLTNTATIWDTDGNLSPDGTTIAFISNQNDPSFDLWIMNADGTNREVLYANSGGQTDIDWAPSTYTFTGFFSPVDNSPTLNSVKAGQAVPVKFGLGGDRGLDIFASGYPKSEVIPCDSTDPVDGVESTVTAGGSSLSYDATTDRYTYVWKTAKAWANTCRQLVVRFDNSLAKRARFMLT